MACNHIQRHNRHGDMLGRFVDCEVVHVVITGPWTSPSGAVIKGVIIQMPDRHYVKLREVTQ
jgi:hypothetical protein